MSQRGLSYRTQNSSELYPIAGLVSLYPGSTSVVSGIPYGMSLNRIDLHLEREIGMYYLRLVGSAEKTPKPLADLSSQLLEERIIEACRHAPRYAKVADVRAEFLKRYYDKLLVGKLTEKAGFSGFAHPGKVYVSFSQFQFAQT